MGQDSRHHATDAAVRELTMGLTGDRFTQEILASRKPLIVAHAEAEERLFRYMVRAHNVRSMMGVPMVLRGRVIGIFTLDDETSCTCSRTLKDIASAFADYSGEAAVAAASHTSDHGRGSCLPAAIDQGRRRDADRERAVRHRVAAFDIEPDGTLARVATSPPAATG
ncbi:GAF domain-containing protein [Pseudonocardia sp. RS010]|uniref:GAF domain-containing protein n=1 Tax=Pseudonocardia sp. RS010 TaxID=3385979 RepID=UPI0039A1A2B1